MARPDYAKFLGEFANDKSPYSTTISKSRKNPLLLLLETTYNQRLMTPMPWHETTSGPATQKNPTH